MFVAVPITASAAVGDFVPESEYLTFTAEAAGSSVTLNVASGSNLQYKNNNSDWASYTAGTRIDLASVGDYVRFRGKNTTFNYSNRVSIGGKVACSGNVMSLRLDDNGMSQGLSDSCFSNMFSGCTGLTAAPELPETTLAYSCYDSMFYSCTNLTTAPELPAEELVSNCYSYMFNGCSSLTTAPELWATSLDFGCYQNMFSGCEKLTTAPELPATSLEPYCYRFMFYRCTSLTTAPALPATELVSNCYTSMFNGCSSIKLSETQTAEYSIPYSVPSGGNGTAASSSTLISMFEGTGGTFTGTPEINKTYYMYVPAPTVPVTDLDFEEHYGEVTVGGKTALTAMIEPDDATDKTVKWSVTQGSDKIKLYEDADCTTEVGEDATDCLTVYVMGVAEGDAVVTVTSNADPTIYAYCDVNVKVPQTITLDLNPDNATVIWYDATDSDGYWSMEAQYNDGCYLVLKGNSNQPAGTYEWADMGSGCGIIDYEANKKIDFVDGSCTVTVDEDVVTVSGTFTGRDRNTYVVTVTYEAPYYTITDESVNGTVTAEVNGADVTKAKAGKTVLLNVAPADGYQLKSITASAQKTTPEDFSDLVALMGDAVFDGDENYDCGGYTCKVENGKFVVYNGANLLAELSESNMTGFNGDSDYVEANSEDALWAFFVENGEITGIDVSDTNDYYIFCSLSGSKSTGTLQPVQVDLTTVTEGSQYSFTMPAKNVTVKAEFEEAAPELPEVIKDCTYTRDSVIYANVPFVQTSDFSPLVNGAIYFIRLADGFALFDAMDYSYKFYDKNGTEITADLGTSTTYPGSAFYLSDDVTIYKKEYKLSNTELDKYYFVATAPAVDLFTGHTVTLDGDIGVNFFLNPAVLDTYDGTKKVKFTCDGEETIVDVPTTATADGYKVTCDVVAARMAHKIKAVVYVGDTALDQTDSYSVQDYAEKVYKNPGKYLPEDKADKANEFQALAAALLHYGGEAQTVFDSALNSHPDRADKNIPAPDYSGVTADAVQDAIKGDTSDLNAVATQLGAKFYTSSLLYLSQNTLRLYFTQNDDSFEPAFFDGVRSDYFYYVQNKDIPAAELDDQQIFIVGNETFTYSALDYVKAVIGSSMTDAQKNLAKALFLYNQAANDYFDEPAPAPTWNTVDLSTLTADYEAQNYDLLTGTLSGNKKITIADGATVTLKNANITLNDDAYYAGITPLGDATILLEGENTVKGGNADYPGVFVPVGKTLTIDGTGSLNASSNGYGCGIGGGYCMAAGNIVINGGTITATGGDFAAGIGSGGYASCGDITIAGTVTQVTATKGEYANSIGAGDGGSCGTISIADPSKVTQN